MYGQPPRLSSRAKRGIPVRITTGSSAPIAIRIRARLHPPIAIRIRHALTRADCDSYQGTASAVPPAPIKKRGFSP